MVRILRISLDFREMAAHNIEGSIMTLKRAVGTLDRNHVSGLRVDLTNSRCTLTRKYGNREAGQELQMCSRWGKAPGGYHTRYL